MIIPLSYTPIQIIVPDDKYCDTILNIWEDIYYANKTSYSHVSKVSLARSYNLIYALIKTKNLNLLDYTYTIVPLISAENIEFYKLDKHMQLTLRKENIKEINCYDGSIEFYKNGRCHRDNDLPAIIYEDGSQEWYKHGEIHRDNDLPAAIYTDGTQEWYKNGELHRDNDLPAIIYTDGSQLWYKNGEAHRDNGLPAAIYSNKKNNGME